MAARILALMENPESIKQIADSLEHFGHIVFKTHNYAGAMDILRQREVDLIVADVHLQNGGSIFDFMRWVRGDPHTHAIPFVCFSTEPVEVPKYLSDGVRTAARGLGAAKYITMEKFDPILFREEIEWLLPHDRAGNYYSEPGDGNGDAEGKEQLMIGPRVRSSYHSYIDELKMVIETKHLSDRAHLIIALNLPESSS